MAWDHGLSRLVKVLKVAAVGPNAVDAINVAALHLKSKDPPFGEDDNIRLAPDLAFVASQPERVKYDPEFGQFPSETFVNVSLAVGAVLGYVGYQDGQFSPSDQHRRSSPRKCFAHLPQGLPCPVRG